MNVLVGTRCPAAAFALLLTCAPLIDRATAADPPSPAAPDIASATAEPYNGPKARIAVADFEDKMSSRGHYRSEYGRGLSDMLTTALFQTNRYIILEREKLAAVIGELKHGVSDLFRRDATTPIGELEGADLLVAAAVTGFDPGVSGGSGVGGTVGGLFGAVGQVLGSIAGGFGKARVTMDLRVIDVRTGRVVAATTAEGSATTFSLGGGAAGGGLGGALGGFTKTPMETAIREMIGQAVAFVVSKTPAQYYRIRPDGAPTPPAAGADPAKAGPPVPAIVHAVVPAATLPAAQPGSGARTPLRVPSDVDPALTLQLDDVRLRGATLSVVITLRLERDKPESEAFEVRSDKSHVMDYATGQTYPVITIDGFSSGRIKRGEVKTLRMTFKAPKEAKTIGVVLSGVGAFDDVALAP